MSQKEIIRKPVRSVPVQSVPNAPEAAEEALDRVFQRYGTDLSAFFRDAYREFALKSEEPDKCEKPY